MNRKTAYAVVKVKLEQLGMQTVWKNARVCARLTAITYHLIGIIKNVTDMLRATRSNTEVTTSYM